MKQGRFGHARYAQILAQVTKQPTTIPEVMESQRTQIQTAREILWRMERLGLIRVCEWREPEARSSFLVPVFCADGGESLPYPKKIGRPPFGSTKGRPRSELVAFASVIRCLKEGATRQKLHEETGIAFMRIGNLIREMRRLKLVHVSDWQERKDRVGRPAEVFSYGHGYNMPRPPTLSRLEIERRHRQKKRAIETMRLMIAATAAPQETEEAA